MVVPAVSKDATEIDWFKDEEKRDRNAQYLILSCMGDDLVHLYEQIKSAKAIWDALQEKYGILSETRLRALGLKVYKLKYPNNKGMDKHLLILSLIFSTLQKAKQLYSDECKSLTLLNSLPDTR